MLDKAKLASILEDEGLTRKTSAGQWMAAASLKQAELKTARAVKEDWPVKLEITSGEPYWDPDAQRQYTDYSSSKWEYWGILYVSKGSSGWHRVEVEVDVAWKKGRHDVISLTSPGPQHPALQSMVVKLLGDALDAAGEGTQGRQARQRKTADPA